MKRTYRSLIGYAAVAVMAFTLCGIYALACGFVYVSPALPSEAAMRNVELQVPLRVYARGGQLIAQIGEQRRIPVTYAEIPELVRHAVLAAEDDRFFSHHGVDWIGVARAMFVNVVSADRAQGASTITMQAARNMVLTLDKTWRRKLQEVFVTYRMERNFTKEEILATYLNVIFFGQRSYGVAAAAETYYGKPLSQLTVGEAATLAGIIQVPSRYNPVASAKLAHTRRAYVLRRMSELGYIDAATAAQAAAEPIATRGYAPLFDVEAPFVAELARQEVLTRFGPRAVNEGYKVYTTIDGRQQTAANRAVRLGLIEYDRRHGFRGAIAKATLPRESEPEKLDRLLDAYPAIGLLQPALVMSLGLQSARVYVRSGGYAQIDWDGISWARPLKNGRLGGNPKKAEEVLTRGDVVYVVTNGRGIAQLAQLPEAQAALVAVDPGDGAVTAMVGGFDYFTSKYNRVTQARRQPGSGFKPFLYSAALDSGLTPASIILDAPVVVDGVDVEGTWRPENDGGEFRGPTRLREALVRSRNLVSIRILRDLGTKNAIEYAARFGFRKEDLPENLTLALGTLPATPLEIATGYATFANGGYRVMPYFFDRIENAMGENVWQAEPAVVCSDCDPPAPPVATPPGGLQPLESREPSVVALAPVPPAPPEPHDIDDAPAGLRDLAAVQGGRGYLKVERVAQRAITAQNAWLMDSMMSDVIRRGTGQRARALGREDIAGKTGTTNDSVDTWFNGFNRDLVATVWVGFDEARPLGAGEEGSRTAIPIWMHFMREALRGVPERPRPMPEGLVNLRISPSTGAVADAADPDSIFETFMIEHLPPGGDPANPGTGATPGNSGGGDPLF
jgi:penicillin-binding protein 1A